MDDDKEDGTEDAKMGINTPLQIDKAAEKHIGIDVSNNDVPDHKVKEELLNEDESDLDEAEEAPFSEDGMETEVEVDKDEGGYDENKLKERSSTKLDMDETLNQQNVLHQMSDDLKVQSPYTNNGAVTAEDIVTVLPTNENNDADENILAEDMIIESTVQPESKTVVDVTTDGERSAFSSDDEAVATGTTEICTKSRMRSAFNRLRSTPLIFLYACKICVVIPIAIYSCDVILSVQVMEDDVGEVIAHNFIMDNLRQFEKHNYTHKIAESHMKRISDIAENLRSKRDSEESTSLDPPLLQVATSKSIFYGNFTNKHDPTTNMIEVEPTISSGPAYSNSTVKDRISPTAATQHQFNSSNIADKLPSVTTEDDVDTNTTNRMAIIRSPDTQSTVETIANQLVMSCDYAVDDRETGQHCQSFAHFLRLHCRYSRDHAIDWYAHSYQRLNQNQQALFFMFTVAGMVFLLVSIVLRCDIFLNHEWSSFIVFPFLVYSISTSITAYVFAVQSGDSGLRCFRCSIQAHCKDIDPWNIAVKIPNINWNLVAVLSFIFKLYDAIMIGIVTLKFVIDLTIDKWYTLMMKIIGWMIAFPLLIFTPALAVIRFVTLPVTLSDGHAALTATEVVFYVGVVLWLLTLATLPVFCKRRMCNKQEYQDEVGDDEVYRTFKA